MKRSSAVRKASAGGLRTGLCPLPSRRKMPSPPALSVKWGLEGGKGNGNGFRG